MKRWRNMPLRKKLLFSGVLIVIMAVLVWAHLGYPALSDETYLHRAERAHLLGEGEFLTKIDPGYTWPKFLVAENGDYVEILRIPSIQDHRKAQNEGFFAYQKEGDFTAVSFPLAMYGQMSREDALTCCLLLFDDRPDVQKVEVTFLIDGESYTSQAEREVGGVFLCYYQISKNSYYKNYIWQWFEPTVTDCVVKLYDAKDAMIEEVQVRTGKVL